MALTWSERIRINKKRKKKQEKKSNQQLTQPYINKFILLRNSILAFISCLVLCMEEQWTRNKSNTFLFREFTLQRLCSAGVLLTWIILENMHTLCNGRLIHTYSGCSMFLSKIFKIATQWSCKCANYGQLWSVNSSETDSLSNEERLRISSRLIL